MKKQQENIVMRLFRSANNNHGRTLQPSEVRFVVELIDKLSRDLATLEQIVEKYSEEFGDSILMEFMDIVEGEVVQDEQLPFEDGQEDEGGGLDSPPETPIEAPVSETS